MSEPHEYEYATVCEVCDTELFLRVVGEEEPPLHCPMCGEQTKYDEIEE